MRILHINCNYIGTTLHQLMIENLDRLGYINQVFVPTYDKTLSVIKPNSNVCVCECFKKWDRLIFYYKQIKVEKGLKNNIRVDEYNLIHAYTLFTDGNCARKISRKYGIPYVVAVRNTDVNSFLRLMPHLRSRGIQIMRDAKAVFFLSESYRKQVFEKYIPQRFQEEIRSKTYIIPNGIDDFWFNNALNLEKVLEKKQMVKLIYAGRIDKNKNISTTQKAMEILKNNGYKVSLTVVGKVQDKKEYRSVSNNKYTKFFPQMPKEKLMELYRASDIFVMPSYTESFGLVYAEAMSQGLPVIYSEGQGFDKQFREGVVGYHVSPYDAKSVAGGIIKIIESYESIQKNVVECAYKFNWQNVVSEYDSIYRMVVKNISDSLD